MREPLPPQLTKPPLQIGDTRCAIHTTAWIELIMPTQTDTAPRPRCRTDRVRTAASTTRSIARRNESAALGHSEPSSAADRSIEGRRGEESAGNFENRRGERAKNSPTQSSTLASQDVSSSSRHRTTFIFRTTRKKGHNCARKRSSNLCSFGASRVSPLNLPCSVFPTIPS